MGAIRGAWGAVATAATVVLIGTGSAEAGLPREFTLHRPSTTQFFMDYDDGDRVPNRQFRLGATTDVARLGDADGDTIADVALFRQGVWFVDLRNDRSIDRTFALGGAGDIPVVGDFLGSGRVGFGVYRPSNGFWYLDRDGNGSVDYLAPWGGVPGDIPVVADYDGDGRADRAVYRGGAWYVDYGLDSTLDALHHLGGLSQDVPLAGDFDGDWKADNAIFRDGVWFFDYGNNGTVDRILHFGGSGDRPLFAPVNPNDSIYVRAGAVGGNGTQAAPLGSLTDAVNMASAGQKIRIAAGTYTEGVCFAGRQNLTFVGAGVAATNLLGANNNACNNSLDGFVVIASQGIVLRNLRVASPSNRSIVGQGTAGGTVSLTLDRVSTIGSRLHGVLVAGVSGSPSTLVAESSTLDRSQIGNGVVLGGGVNATIRRSTVDWNGSSSPADAGHGVVSFLDTTLLVEYSSVSHNFHSGLLFDHTSSGVVRYNALSFNGHAAVFFEKSTSGDVHDNVMDTNGHLGTRGATTGFNAIELFGNYNGPSMQIYANSIYRSTTNGIFVGSGNATVSNNFLYDNYVGLTVAFSSNVGVFGNVFELPLSQANEEGLFIQGPGVTVTVGGAAGLRNTFRNYIGNPAIHCNGSLPETVICPSGGNIFQNDDLPIIGCPPTCQP